MSIDIDWAQLDAELCSRALASINTLLRTTTRPGFLGDIVASQFSLGSVSPELEIVEIRDVFEEFLHIDEDDEDEEILQASSTKRGTGSPTASLGGFSSHLSRPLGTPGLFSPATTAGPLWMPRNSLTSNSTTTGFPFPRLGGYHAGASQDLDRRSNASSSAYTGMRRELSPSAAPPSDPASSISVQLHFRVKYTGNLSIALQTSLQVNYPSLAFMSLPLSMRLSGIAFEGTIVVAYEGDRKRLHVSILDSDESERAQGHRLLRDVVVESEIGQADKLVVKDLEKVEQFVVEVARKALEDEIAWPNFQSFAWT